VSDVAQGKDAADEAAVDPVVGEDLAERV